MVTEVPFNQMLETRASLGYVKDFYRGSSQLIQEPNTLDIYYDILLDMFRNDPVLTTAIDITVEACTYNSFDFVGENKRLIDEANKLFFEKFDFDRILDNILYSLLIYGDAFLELRRTKGTTIDEIHPLETTEMAIQYDEHGKISGYVQRPKGKSPEEYVYFDTESVIHYKLKWIGSRVYSYTPFESINRSYSTKIYANNYLQTIFKNLPPKIIYALESVGEKQREEFRENLIQAKSNPNLDLVARGKIETKVNQINFDQGLPKVLDYLRQEVLMITRVPPMWVGMVDNSNRSIGEAVMFPFEIRIKKLQQIIASENNKNLLPKLGLKNLKFIFHPVSLIDDKSILENARQLKDMGLKSKNKKTEHPVIHYLRKKGFQIPFDVEIEDSSAIKDERGFPSRKRENPMMDKINSELNKKE